MKIDKGHETLRKAADLLDGELVWNQGIWFTRLGDDYTGWCGTAACVAGAVVLADGWKPKFFNAKDSTAYMCERDGRARAVASVARELLFDRFREGVPWVLFNPDHGPLDGRTVSGALRMIADGAEIETVWGDPDEYEDPSCPS